VIVECFGQNLDWLSEIFFLELTWMDFSKIVDSAGSMKSVGCLMDKNSHLICEEQLSSQF